MYLLIPAFIFKIENIKNLIAITVFGIQLHLGFNVVFNSLSPNAVISFTFPPTLHHIFTSVS